MKNYKKFKISEIIESEVKQFDGQVKLFDGYYLNWHEIVRRIKLYKADKFLEERDDGAIFWNIGSPLSPHFKKNIDLDTKDFQPEGKGETNFIQAWILKLRFQKWARESGLALTLNDLSTGLTDYGIHIWKLVNGDDGKRLDNVDLSRLWFDVTAKKLTDGPIIEEHHLTEYEIREREDIWDNTDLALENAELLDEQQSEVPTLCKYKIFERFGEWIAEGKTKPAYYHHIICGKGDKEVILFEEKIEKEDCIYYCFSLKNVDGRLPGIGVYERLFKIQEQANELVNLNRETNRIASLLLLRTTDPNTTGNVLQGAISGQIINSADLQQIGIDNRFLNGFISELQLIEAQAQKLCMTPEVVTGENLPSGTTFRGQAALTNAARTAFKNIIDDVGTLVVDILLERILPSIVKTWNRGELLELIDDEQDVKLYDEALRKAHLFNVLFIANSQGVGLEDEEIMLEEKKTQDSIEENGRKIEIEKGFFNFEYGIKINPTNETVDKAQQNDAYSNILQWIQTNPAIQNNPYFRQYCENNGITPIRMKQEEVMQEQAMMNPVEQGIAEPQTDKLSALINQ